MILAPYPRTAYAVNCSMACFSCPLLPPASTRSSPCASGVALEQTCPDHLFVSQANDVQLSPRRLFIPDVLVTTFEAAKRGSGKFAATEIVLAAEIVSPSSQSMDRVMKPSLYAKAGIPYYWMIEIDGGITVHTYKLEFEDEVYQPSGTFTDTIRIDEPWRIEIPIAGLRPRNL